MLRKLDDYNLENLTILVIDDSRHMLTIVRNLLNSMRIKNVTMASDAADAFKELRHSRPDIVIVDWHMSPLDGLDFTRLVRKGQDSEFPDIPILLLTAHTEARRIFEARDAGVNEILAKPVSFKTLYQRIVAVINDSRPFVRLNSYVGPCRRRREMDEARRNERRKRQVESTAE